MTHENYLDEKRKALKESVDFFRPDKQVERDKSVVSDLLKTLGVVFDESDLQQDIGEPIDIQFRGAKFQIKEIMDSDRRRHSEYKEALNKALIATESRDLLVHSTPRDIRLTEIYDEILSRSSNLLNKYAAGVCQSLDLLFYVNLLDVYDLIETPYPDISSLRSQPWRSVSFVMGFKACVLFARDDAPAFLKSAMSKVIHRPGKGV